MSSVQVQFQWNIKFQLLGPLITNGNPTHVMPAVSPLIPHLLRRQISDCLFAVHRHHSTYPADLPSLISNLVLTHPAAAAATAACDGDAASLSLALSSFSLSPSVVDDVLKRLWNDGPRALLFFRALLLLPSYSPSPSTFDLAIDIAARLRHPRSLRFFLSRRLPLSLRTFSILAERFVAAGKPDRAVRLFLSLHHHGLRQDLRSFNSLLDVLCKSRRVRKAASLFRFFRARFRADAVTYNILADGWCRVKHTAAALDVLKEMVDSGLEPTLTTYNILLKGFFRAGQVKEGWEFFLQMKKRGRQEVSCCLPDVISYTTVVHGLGISGRTNKARKVFDEMINQGCLPSVATYNAFIQVLCKKDCIQNALLAFDEMLMRGYTPNVTTYNVVIRGLCHSGEMDRASEFMERMCCEPNVQTYNILIRHWCDEGEMEKGLELLERMKVGGVCMPNLDTYNVLISGMFARRRSDDMVVAGRMVMEMVERGHLPRRFMLNKVLNGLLLTGNQDFARELLRMQDRFGRFRREIRLL